MSTFEKIQNILLDVFNNPSLEISEETSAQDIHEWDSLAQINIIIAIESEFKIKIALGEIDKLRNVGDIVLLVDSKS